MSGCTIQEIAKVKAAATRSLRPRKRLLSADEWSKRISERVPAPLQAHVASIVWFDFSLDDDPRWAIFRQELVEPYTTDYRTRRAELEDALRAVGYTARRNRCNLDDKDSDSYLLHGHQPAGHKVGTGYQVA